jgi:hypothetical protein
VVHEFFFNLRSTCGTFTMFGYITPVVPSLTPGPGATQWNLVGTIVNDAAVECRWVDGTGCTYVAANTSDTVVAVSPTAPNVTGNTGISTWSKTPIPGTGTNVWSATVYQNVDDWVTIDAPAGTSGFAVTN